MYVSTHRLIDVGNVPCFYFSNGNLRLLHIRFFTPIIEFWTHSSSGSGKELSSPSDVEITKNLISSGLGSQSSSSQNSLCDLKRYELIMFLD